MYLLRRPSKRITGSGSLNIGLRLCLALLSQTPFVCCSHSVRSTSTSTSRARGPSVENHRAHGVLLSSRCGAKLSSERRIKRHYSVSYNSLNSGERWSQIYTIEELNLSFVKTYSGATTQRAVRLGQRDILRLAPEILEEGTTSEPATTTDSMDINICYNEASSEFYGYHSDPSCLLVKSQPMNWVGLMNKLSFFELIDLTEMTTIEFIAECASTDGSGCSENAALRLEPDGFRL